MEEEEEKEKMWWFSASTSALPSLPFIFVHYNQCYNIRILVSEFTVSKKKQIQILTW